MIANEMKTNTGKILVAVLAMVMVFSCVAIAFSDSEVQAADEDATYLGGSITGDTQQVYGAGTNVIIDRDLTIPNEKKLDISGKLTINEGVTVTVEAGGQFILNSGSEVVIDRNVTVNGPSASVDTAGVFVNASDNVKVNGTVTLYRGGEMGNGQDVGTSDAGNGVLTVTEGGSVVLTKRLSNIAQMTNQTIVLYPGATFDVQGHVNNVYIKATGDARYYTAGAMSITNDINPGSYTEKTTSELVFTVSESTTPALTDPADDKSRITLREYTLNVDGTVNGGDVLSTFAGVSMNEDAAATFFDVEHGEKNGDSYRRNAYEPQTSVTGTLTVAVGSTLTVAEDTTLNIAGTVTLASSTTGGTTTAGAIVLNGSIVVTGTLTGTATSTSVTVSTPTITVDGGTVSITANNDAVAAIGTGFAKAHVYGTFYVVEGLNDSIVYLQDFDDAIANAVANAVEEITVYSYGLQNRTTAEGAIYNGAYAVDSELTIPADLIVNIWNSMVVTESGNLIIEDGAEIVINDGTGRNTTGKLFVEGKVTDYGGCMIGYEGDDSFLYEVKKTTETDTETIAIYTTLEMAIFESNPGDVINLNGIVNITEDLTIPTDVTVVSDEGVTVTGATLTVNGVLDMNKTDITLAPAADDETDVGNVVVNNYVADVSDTNYDNQAVKIPGAYFNGTIGDYEEVNLIAAGAVAGQYSTTASDAGITLYGKLSMGEVAFTQGEEQSTLAITVVGEVSRNVTLVGNDMDFAMTGEGASFTGAVSSAVTARTSTIDFSKASGNTVSVNYTDDGSAITTTMGISGTLSGTATVSAATVDADNTFTAAAYASVGKVKSVITVGTGATLNVADGITVATGTDAEGKAYSTLVVDGTLAYTDGTFTNNGILDINGTMTVAKNVTIGGTIEAGTITVADGVALTVAKMTVGDAEGASGSVSGAIEFNDAEAVIIAYPAANMSGAQIAVVDGVSQANVTTYYINGDVYMTSYVGDNVNFGGVIDTPVSLVGFEDVAANQWYDNAEMDGEPINAEASLSEIPAAYAVAQPSEAYVYVSVGPNMSIFIDDVRYPNGAIIPLTVGEHSINVQVNPGFTGTTFVSFDGVAVTGGTFTVTPEMADEYGNSTQSPNDCVVLSVTGQVSQDVPVVSGVDNGDSGMGLTDYLLIILVVLIVIMAIMVAMRLMRS